MDRYHNVLIIQLGDVGDVVLSTPTIRALKETCPGARVSILVRKPYGSLLSADPHIHEVVEFARVRGPALRVAREFARFAGRLRRGRYDLVIDLRTGDRGAFLSFLSGGKSRIGREDEGRPFWHRLLFTRTVRYPAAAPPPVHPGADQSLRILRAIGIDTKDSVPRLYIAGSDRERADLMLAECGLRTGGSWFTFNPFSRWKYKEWDNGKWAEVINRLWEEYRTPWVLVGSPEESAAAGDIVAACSGHAFNLAGKTTLGELAAIIATSSLHVGVDSAAPHIAAAVGTPSITIHGPSDWRAWRTVTDRHAVVFPKMACVPCNRKGCGDSEQSSCLKLLEVESVVEVVREMHGRHPAKTS